MRQKEVFFLFQMENYKDQYCDSTACSIISEKEYSNLKIVLFSSMQIYFASDTHHMEHSLTKPALSSILLVFLICHYNQIMCGNVLKTWKNVPHYKHVKML